MKKLTRRKKTAHKGDFGRVTILAGSKDLTGAAHLASSACIRSGAGLVTLGVPEAVYKICARREAEVMVKPFASTREGTLSFSALNPILKFTKNQDVLALGPGLSQNKQAQKLVRALVAKTKQPLVLDADALNAFVGNLSALKKAKGRAILTPHPGEFSRLFGEPRSTSSDRRKEQAKKTAKKFGVIIVLKGHNTVVAAPNGKCYINKTGNPGMATGGTGDVLTGVIAALLAQKLSLWEAACLGVSVHGFAGDIAAKHVGEISLIASDLIQYLPKAFQLST